MDNKQQALFIIKEKGPLLPKDISTALNIDTFLAGAVLSELSSEKKIKITFLKIGGSPLYYLPEQAIKLTQFSDKLNEKDKRAYDLLKERKILRDDKMTSLLRVSLKNIKDFAIPLRVNIKEQSLIFWKWFLLSSQEAEQLIKKQIDTKPAEKPKEEPKPIKEKQEVLQQKPKPITKQPTPKQDKTPEISKQGDFLEKLESYFNLSKIEVLNKEIIRKNSEIDFILKIPSSIGVVEYYCKAKSKKKSNHNDLSTAFVQGQIRKLPVLYLTTGTLTKKAQEMLNNEFKNLIFKTI